MEDRPLQFLANQSAEQLIFIAAPGSSSSVDWCGYALGGYVIVGRTLCPNARPNGAQPNAFARA
jgi:hypothetical protein